MGYKYRKMLPLFLLFTGAMVTGCSNNDFLSDDEILKVDSYITSMASKESVDIYELQNKISESIPKIKNKDDASSIINKYIYILYNEAANYLPYFDIIGKDIVDIKNELNIEKIDVSMYKEVSTKSKVVGAILEEMYNKDLMVIDESNSFFTEVNMEKILDKYREYLNTDIIEFLEFRASENAVPVFNVNSDEYDLDVLLERAALSVEKIADKQNSEQLGNWQSTAAYYYEIILADKTNQFLEEDNKISDEYIKALKTKIDKYKDRQIYTDVTRYIELLENNNYDINADDVASYRATLLERILADNTTK